MQTVLLSVRLVAVVAMVGFASSAWAEEVPSFALEYSKEKATHVVVVDADGAVLESWRGDLAKGDKLPFKAAQKPIAVVNPFPAEPRDPKVASVTGNRRVLFLIRAKTGDSWTPAGYMLPEERFATVWIEEGHCFAIYQFTNPGNGAMMHPLYMDERRLKQEVLRGHERAKGEKAAVDDLPKDSVGPKTILMRRAWADDAANDSVRKKWEAIPLPTKTPFDGDAWKWADFMSSYRYGYFWAQGTHIWCPTNPQEDNLHAIRGWIEGWQAGVKDGGQGDLPAKYAPYLIWRDDGKR